MDKIIRPGHHKDWSYTGSDVYNNPNNPYQGTDGRQYVQYRNYKFSERFDHIGITIDGKITDHKAISYINGIDPTETVEENGQKNTRIWRILKHVQVEIWMKIMI